MEHTIGSREWNLTQWTIVYRKPRANRFRRAVNWHGTWKQARAMAIRFNDRFPTLEVWYTTTKAYDDHHQHDDAHVLTANTGKRVRIMDTGEIPADMLPGSGTVWHDEDDHSTVVPEPERDPEWWTSADAGPIAGMPEWQGPYRDTADRNSLAEHRMHMDTPEASCAPTCPYYAETIQAANVFGAISGDGTLAGAAARLIQTGGEVARTVEAEDAAYEAERDPRSARTDDLAGDQGDRPMYAYVVEGGINTGPLTRYAHDVEMAHYAGLYVSNRLTMLTVRDDNEYGGQLVHAGYCTPEYRGLGAGRDEEGYETFACCRIVVRDSDDKILDAADYTIDLRA